MACSYHAVFDPGCRACRDEWGPAAPARPVRAWVLVLAALAAFVFGTLVGLVSNWIDSLHYVVLVALALALVGWFIYWADKLSRRSAQPRASRTPVSGSTVASGAVLVAALGLAAARDSTAALVLVGTLLVVVRLRARSRKPRAPGPRESGRSVGLADRWRTGPHS